MAGAIMSKLMDFIGMEQEEEEYEDVEDIEEVEQDDEEEEEEARGFWNKRSGKVVNMPAQQQVKMVISQPTTFEQSETICDLLKEKKSIIVNLEYVNKDVARRIVDVISGAVHALDGHMQKVSNSIFLIAPYNYDISTDVKEEAKSKFQFRA